MRTPFSIVLATGVAFLIGSETIRASGRGTHQRLAFSTSLARHLVERAIEGSKRRLADPECQKLFTDFQDPSGNSLLANLLLKRKTPAEYVDELWFVDASNAGPCRRGLQLVSYTSPGHRVIYVCGSRFVHPIFRLDQRIAELLIIHEVLHSLGLGEDPPAHEQITKQVVRRCGR